MKVTLQEVREISLNAIKEFGETSQEINEIKARILQAAYKGRKLIIVDYLSPQGEEFMKLEGFSVNRLFHKSANFEIRW